MWLSWEMQRSQAAVLRLIARLSFFVHSIAVARAHQSLNHSYVLMHINHRETRTKYFCNFPVVAISSGSASSIASDRAAWRTSTSTMRRNTIK